MYLGKPRPLASVTGKLPQGPQHRGAQQPLCHGHGASDSMPVLSLPHSQSVLLPQRPCRGCLAPPGTSRARDPGGGGDLLPQTVMGEAGRQGGGSGQAGPATPSTRQPEKHAMLVSPACQGDTAPAAPQGEKQRTLRM